MEKKLILKKIELSNFRGQTVSVDFSEKETRISGRNGVGKSTVLHGWLWLFTSYTNAGSVKNYNLFDNKEELSQDTPLAKVKATIELGGYEYTIEKTAAAKFIRRRGSNEWEKASSDEYKIFIDNIETSTTAFNSWIESNICSTDILPYILDGHFFIDLLNEDKAKSRKVLETLVTSEVRYEDMKGDYSLIQDDMQRYTVEQIEEKTKAEIKPLKARMNEIPAIIDNKRDNLSEYSKIDFATFLVDIERKKKDIEDVDSRILGNGKAIEPIMGERNKIYDLINTKTLLLNELRMDYNTSETSKIHALKTKIAEIEKENSILEKINSDNDSKRKLLKSRVSNIESDIVKLTERREFLLKERDEIKERVFTEESCTYCGQELPADLQEGARAKFNERKNKELEEIVGRGKRNSEEISRLKSLVDDLNSDILNIPTHAEIVDTTELKEQLKGLERSYIPFENTEVYAKIDAEIRKLNDSLPVIPSNDNEALTELKKSYMMELESLNRKYGLKVKLDEIIEEIEKLKEELRSVGNNIAWLEGKIAKCKEYLQEKADIISFRVNKHLKTCSIDMWSVQKDGSLVPDVVLRGKDNVKYGSLNFSDQIKVSIELQEFFMRYADISLPIFIDEYSVFSENNKPEIEGQSVCLYATNSPYLIVE